MIDYIIKQSAEKIILLKEMSSDNVEMKKSRVTHLDLAGTWWL